MHYHELHNFYKHFSEGKVDQLEICILLMNERFDNKYTVQTMKHLNGVHCSGFPAEPGNLENLKIWILSVQVQK